MIKGNTLKLVYVPNLLKAEKQIRKELEAFLEKSIQDTTPLPVRNKFKPKYQILRHRGIEDYLRTSDSFITVYDNDHICAFSKLKHNALVEYLEEYENNLLIDLTLVAPNYRYKGVGQLIYREIEDLNVEEFHHSVIIRTTWDTNLTQIHLYKKLGYSLQLLPERNKDYGQKDNVKWVTYTKQFNFE